MTFNQYVQSFVGGLSGTVGWGSDTIDFVVLESLEAYGASTEAEAIDSVKAHAILRWKTLERMFLDMSDEGKYSADGESFDPRFVQNIEKRLDKARLEALPYLPQSEIEQGRMTFPDDPYSILGQVEHDA